MLIGNATPRVVLSSKSVPFNVSSAEHPRKVLAFSTVMLVYAPDIRSIIWRLSLCAIAVTNGTASGLQCCELNASQRVCSTDYQSAFLADLLLDIAMQIWWFGICIGF